MIFKSRTPNYSSWNDQYRHIIPMTLLLLIPEKDKTLHIVQAGGISGSLMEYESQYILWSERYYMCSHYLQQISVQIHTSVDQQLTDDNCSVSQHLIGYCHVICTLGFYCWLRLLRFHFSDINTEPLLIYGNFSNIVSSFS